VVSRLLGLDVIEERLKDQVMERLGRRGDDPLMAGC
jgi:hypothetical protein